MSRIYAQILGASAAVALVIAPLATASQAVAASATAPRHTLAMEMADMVGSIAGLYAEMDKLDGRSVKPVRTVLDSFNTAEGVPFKITVTGLTDSNHDGLDDDAKLKVRVLDNVATLTLHQDRTYSLADGGFVFKNRRSVLKESAQAFDRILRLAATLGEDTWQMALIKDLKTEMPSGVRVVSDYDGNHDGYDDDGRLTFLANGKAVTLTIGNTGKQVGKVTYGPTWRTKAPKRTHHPVTSSRTGSALIPR